MEHPLFHDQYTHEAVSPQEPGTKAVISWLFRDAQRRAYWSTYGLTDEDINHDFGQGARTIGAIVAHQIGLIRFMVAHLNPDAAKQMTMDGLANPETSPRRFRLDALVERRQGFGERFLQELNAFPEQRWMEKPAISFAKLPEWKKWPVLQRVLRPLDDYATHVGQVCYVRRLLGEPLS